MLFRWGSEVSTFHFVLLVVVQIVVSGGCCATDDECLPGLACSEDFGADYFRSVVLVPEGF